MRLARFIFKTAAADEVRTNSYGLATAGLMAVVLNLFISAPKAHYLPRNLLSGLSLWSTGAYVLGPG